MYKNLTVRYADLEEDNYLYAGENSELFEKNYNALTEGSDELDLNAVVTAAWLTYNDIDYTERMENDDFEDLYDDEYTYIVEIDGREETIEMDIDLT